MNREEFDNLVFANINKTITEHDFIIKLESLIHRGFNLADIKDINQIMFQQKESGLNISFKYTFLSFIVLDLCNRYWGIYCPIKNNSEWKIGSKSLLSSIIKTKINIKTDYNYVKAFKNIIETTEDGASEEDMSENDKIPFKYEIIERLDLLVTYFGLNTIRSFGVKPITLRELLDMSYKEAFKYYSNTIRIIRCELKEIEILCDNYVRLENSLLSTIVHQSIH